MTPEAPLTAEQPVSPCSASAMPVSPAFGALKPKAPPKLRQTTMVRVGDDRASMSLPQRSLVKAPTAAVLSLQGRTFFDSADYQLAAMQARENKDVVGASQSQHSVDWRALVTCSSQAPQASIPTAHHSNSTSPFHIAHLATPGTQPLCRGVHRPSRLSQAGI